MKGESNYKLLDPPLLQKKTTPKKGSLIRVNWTFGKYSLTLGSKLTKWFIFPFLLGLPPLILYIQM